MAGRRASKLQPIEFRLGYYTNQADRDQTGTWKDGNRVRFHKGAPEKIGGWERIALTGYNSGVYTGVARALHDWSTLDAQQFIAVGTECKLHLVNSGRLHDITPQRKSSNVTNPFTTVSGSPIVTVADPDHRARAGDHVFVVASSAVGGLTLAGDYAITTILTPNSYTITASSNATSSANGGGATSFSYDLNCGLASNGELRGYGTGLYGDGTFGTIRPVASGVPRKLRTWSLANFGEDLVASPSGGGLYHWEKTNGTASRAMLISEAPAAINRMTINPQSRQIIALGCTGQDGVFDGMLIRWGEQESLNGWISDELNTAGNRRLDIGSMLITGVRSRGQILVWSDIFLYSMYFLNGDRLGYGFDEKGSCSIVGPNAAVDANGIVFFMAFDDFYMYDGTLRVIRCDVHTKIFGSPQDSIVGLLERTQAEKVYASVHLPKTEVRWDMPSSTGENDFYVVYNWTEDCWYYGQMNRTAYHGISAAITGFLTNPYGANSGYLYKHEFGKDEIEGSTVTPQDWFLESYDSNIGGSDAVFLMTSIVPNFDRFTGTMSMTLKKKNRPLETTYNTRGPYQITPLKHDIGVRAKASQIALRLESEGTLGDDFRLGKWQVMATPYGARTGKPSGSAMESIVATAPVLSGLLSEDEDTIDLSWTAGVAGTFPIVSYSLFRSVDGGAFTLLTSVTFGLPRVYADTDVDAGSTYAYFVIARDSMLDDSLQSNTVTISIPVVLGCFLAALSPATASAGDNPRMVALSPNGLNAYTPNNSSENVSQFSRDPITGLLTPLSPATVSAGAAPPPANGPIDALVSPDGAHLYLTNFDADRVYMYSRNLSTGHLTALSPFTILAEAGTHRIAITPDGAFVYATNQTTRTVSQYSRNPSTGQLTALSPATVSVGAIGTVIVAIQISPDGLFAYVGVQGNGEIHQFSISSGQLVPLSPATAATLAGTTDLVLSSDGAYAYATDNSSLSLAQFSRNSSTGLLSPLSPSTINYGGATIIVRLAAHPDGNCLYGGNLSGDFINQFTSTNGVLALLSPVSVGAGDGPVGVSVSPDGLNLYAANSISDNVSQFSIS